MAKSPNEMIALARHRAGLKAEYFRGTLLSLVVTEMTPEQIANSPPGMDTMGVTKDGVLVYNPAWVMKQDLDELAGTMVHEGLHLILESSARCGSRDHYLWNIAADLAINQIVEQMGMKLPKGCVSAKAFGFNLNETADHYYAKLMEMSQQAQKALDKLKGESSGPGAGQCGTCAAGGKDDKPHEDGRSEAAMARMRAAQAQAVRDAQQSGRQAGNIPAELARWSEEQLTPPKVPWQQQLARWARSYVSMRKGMRNYTYSRPSRRQWGLPDDAVRLPTMIDQEIKVAIAIDTSGSMAEAELAKGLSEAQGILVAAGCKVRAIVCDAQVHEDCEVSNAMELRKKLKGGGGTDFRPVFDALTKRQGRPDVLVFFTDGFGPAPEKEPPMGVIWLVIGGGPQPATWGELIRV